MNFNIMIILISLLVGLLVAAIGTGHMKAQLTSIRNQSAAGFYESQQLHLTESKDVFLYKRVTKIPRQQQNNMNQGNRPGNRPGGISVTNAPHQMSGPGAHRPAGPGRPMGRRPSGPGGRGPGRR